MRVTILLIIAVLAVFAYGAFSDTEALFNTYGFSGQNFLERPYVIITSIFLHGGIEHLLSNILIWLFFGFAVEKELGAAKMLAIFFLGAFAGDLASLPIYGFNTVSIGASAGIFALIGVGMLVRPVDLSLYPFFVPVPLALLGMFYAIYNAYEFVFGPATNISYIGHFGGLIVGLVFGLKEKGFKQSMKIILVTLAVMILLPLLFLLLVGRI